MSRVIVLCLAVLFVMFARAIPKPEDDEPKQAHYVQTQHNPAYDHEAFLGEEAKTFDQLSPEESTRRLAIIVERIDKDKDGFVTQEELKDWIKYTQQKYIRDDVERHWRSHLHQDGAATGAAEPTKLPWSEYKKTVYGFMDEHEEQQPSGSKEAAAEEERISYATMLKRDRRRWSVADLDGDDALTKEEFTAFMHPEESEHMRDIVVQETMEDIDKDGDGKISLIEYIGDMYRGSEDEEEPEWVKNEKEQFATYRDKDGDGFMANEEVKNWIIPADFDHAEAESKHLIYEADVDADQKLTKEEILEKYDVFVGSQATDFGEALARHDEF